MRTNFSQNLVAKTHQNNTIGGCENRSNARARIMAAKTDPMRHRWPRKNLCFSVQKRAKQTLSGLSCQSVTDWHESKFMFERLCIFWYFLFQGHSSRGLGHQRGPLGPCGAPGVLPEHPTVQESESGRAEYRFFLERRRAVKGAKEGNPSPNRSAAAAGPSSTCIRRLTGQSGV